MERKPERSSSATVAQATASMVPSGVLGQFEQWLGDPAWFRAGTDWPPAPAPIPRYISIADDLQILVNIVRHDAAEAVCRGMATSVRSPHSEVWSSALRLAPSVGDAIAFLVSQLSARNPLLSGRLEASGEMTALTLTAFVEPPAKLLMLVGAVLMFLRDIDELAAAVGGKSGCRLDIELPAIAWLEGLLAEIGLPTNFDAPATILRVPKPVMNHRNFDSDPVLWDVTKLRLLQMAADAGSLPGKVADLVRAALIAGVRAPKLAAAAAAFRVSERTLVRRLGLAGTSYAQILEAEKRRFALLLMADPSLSLQQVAEKLGYPERASFGRAFRRWQGESPARYRRSIATSAPTLA